MVKMPPEHKSFCGTFKRAAEETVQTASAQLASIFKNSEKEAVSRLDQFPWNLRESLSRNLPKRSKTCIMQLR